MRLKQIPNWIKVRVKVNDDIYITLEGEHKNKYIIIYPMLMMWI
jgi:hypothetical protein